MNNQTFSKKEAIVFGWNTVKSHFLFFLGLLIIIWAIPAFISFISEEAKESLPILFFLILLANWVLSIIFKLGLIHISLLFTDQVKPKYSDLFVPIKQFFPFVFASILYALIIIGGFILLIVPGIIWSIKYGLYRYLIVDKKMGPIEALKKSGEITKGHKMNLFLFGLLLALLNILGVLALGVGLLVTIPISIVASAYVYRKILGEAKEILENEVVTNT